ncbi:hypothetical protein PPSIR1_27463 [Plesiocystis pacifica SIR-1]|uniref:Lipoprotein n=1 Tax=Plesiocystis pacifica SIR-1 TaxID=391625 RepID=A6G4Q7_9BACT|nr:ferritin-like domain-containing protein [Plesiocystis pacifica]EDM79177.1 hypothetical protein PPSIR1_27463 [Plesiocystis pacifica SIR-1]
MRDTEVLRRQLWAQIGLPLATAALLSACDGGETTTRESGGGERAADAQDAPASRPSEDATVANEAVVHDAREGHTPAARTTTNAKSAGYVPPSSIDDIPEGEFDYFGPSRDPFGEHAEEEGCPSGDWCGPVDEATKFAMKGTKTKEGCPAKIVANADEAGKIDQGAQGWKGFSFHPMMQGRLVVSTTRKEREAGADASTCCYHWFEYCSGRPLLDGETPILAELQDGDTWSCDAQEVSAPDDHPDERLPAAVRARLGELWIEDARAEHASIAAFMRVTLELMAMAAPSELLAEVQQAAQDEVQHAQRCFGLAARFSGRQREPGVLPTLEPRVSDIGSGDDWVRLSVDTFIEGCVGETIAALIARRGLRRCEDPATFHTLEQITDDEGRHAGLAWRTISWALSACGEHRPAVLAALRETAQARLERVQAKVEAEALPEKDPDAALLARFGRLDPRGELLAQRDAWEELILPTLEAIAKEADDPAAPAWA